MPFSTSSHSFIFASDYHIGNNFGVCTPSPELAEGQGYYQPNELQDKLYEGYNWCIGNIKQPKKIHALFLGGDLVDGPNIKKPGKDLWTVDPIVSAFDFNKLVWPVASKATKVFGIRGSDYHVSPDRTVINYDELACQIVGTDNYRTGLANPNKIDRNALAQKVKELRAKGKKRSEINLGQLIHELEKQRQQQLPYKEESNLAKKLRASNNVFKKDAESIASGIPARAMPYPLTNVRFKGLFGRVAIVLKHFVSFSPNYMYRGTGLIRNDLIQTLQKERHFPNGYSKIIMAYGHVHYLHWSGNATHYNFTIPCMKANDNYLRANGVTEPDYGIMEVIIEPNEDVLLYPYVLSGDMYPVEEPYKI